MQVGLIFLSEELEVEACGLQKGHRVGGIQAPKEMQVSVPELRAFPVLPGSYVAQRGVADWKAEMRKPSGPMQPGSLGNLS